MPHNDLLKAFHNDGHDSNGTLVIVTGHQRLIWHGDNGGGLETLRNYGIAQGDVKHVSENTC